jgi:uncharacterized membrane protein YsdA (DUF1294 family)
MLVLYYYILTNAIGVMVYGFDKMAARSRSWRIPEKTLFAISVLGGCLGAMGAMILFRHKTRHLSFWAVNIACCFIHGFIIYFFMVR